MSDSHHAGCHLLTVHRVSHKDCDCLCHSTSHDPKSEMERDALALALNPDCRDGKHHACNGDGWDMTLDQPAACACSCHASNWIPLADSRLSSPAVGKCNRCRRSTWAQVDIGEEDRMSQPDGNPCGGLFVRMPAVHGA